MQVQLTLFAEEISRCVYRNYDGDEAVMDEYLKSQKYIDILIDFLKEEPHNLIKLALDLLEVDTSLQEDVIKKLSRYIRSQILKYNKDNMDSEKVISLGYCVFLWEDHFHDERDVLQQSIIEAEEDCERKPTSLRAIRSLKKKRIEIEDGGEVEKCMVCLEDFCNKEKVTCMPCPHIFHEDCITKWLLQNHVCPVCRYEMPRAYQA